MYHIKHKLKERGVLKLHIKEKGLFDNIIEIITNYLMEERLFNVAYLKTRESIEHDQVEKKLISLSNNIRDKMGSEQHIFMQYEELSTLDENSLLRDAYKQGFTDGIELFKEMK